MTPTLQARAGVLAIIIVGALAALGSAGLGLGSLSRPGPGLWPIVVSLGVVVFGIGLLISPGDSAVEPIDRRVVVVLAGCASLVVYAVLFERVGFEIPTILLLVLWMRVFGGDGWRTTLLVAVGATVAVYLLFIVGLSVSLPHLIAF